MPFGKHKGEYLDDIPGDYLEWVLENCELNPYLRTAIENSLDPPVKLTGSEITQAKLEQWYRTMALRFHPDKGGTDEQMKVVNACREELERVIKR